MNDLNLAPKKRHRWSLRAGFWFSLGLVAVVSIVVFLVVDKSIGVKLEIFLGIISLFVFAFLFYVLYFLLWLGLGGLFTAIFVLSVPLFFLVRRSLRAAVARGRTCRGNVGKSLAHALLSTAKNTGWLYCILIAGHALVGFLGK